MVSVRLPNSLKKALNIVRPPFTPPEDSNVYESGKFKGRPYSQTVLAAFPRIRLQLLSGAK